MTEKLPHDPEARYDSTGRRIHTSKRGPKARGDADSAAQDRPRGEPGRTTKILNVRLPASTFARFAEAAGSDYGARSELFRKMFQAWEDGLEVRQLKAKYREALARAAFLERKLAEIEAIVHR